MPTQSSKFTLPHRWWMLGTMAVMSGLALLGFFNGPILGSGDPQDPGATDVGLIEELMDEFGYEANEVLLVLEGDDLFRPDALAATRALVRSFEALQTIEAVYSVDTIPKQASLLGSAALLPPDGSPEEDYARGRELALQHPLVHGLLSDADGTTWLLPVALNYEYVLAEEGPSRTVLARDLQAVLEKIELPADMRASLTGEWILTEASESTFLREQWLYHSIAYLLVFLLGAILFRGPAAVVLAGGGPVIGVLWAFGLAKLFGLYLSSLTLILLPVMLMMIGFTDSVHLMLHVRKQRSRGQSPAEATAAALKLLALPCILTSVTTGLGFASLLIARSELVREFGSACALGVLCTLLAVLTFLPFFASTRLGRGLKERESSRLVDRFIPISDKLQNFISRKARVITVLGCLLTAGALIHGWAIETETRVSADIPRSSAAARALRLIDRAFGGSNGVQIDISWDESQDENWETIARTVKEVEDVVKPETEHSRPLSLTTVLSFLSPSGNLQGGITMLGFLPKRLTGEILNRKERSSRIEFYVPDLGYRHFEPTYALWQARLDTLAESCPGFEFELGGQAIWTGQRYRIFTEDLMESLALAALIMFAILTATFRSLRLGLISIVPNAIPLAATASLLVVMDIPMAGSTAFVMSLGIAVDDTIHFLTRFRHEMAIDNDLDRAIRSSVRGVGKALVMTTVVLVVGFAAVMTSEFPRNRVFSGMICITLVAALVSDLVLLPAMLRTFSRRSDRAQ
ncbi:MAG: putative RND superfamily exporter protein [Candidatus Paceibacteria bacterium]|jgi:predicted RND superfamily exporter protein